MGTASSIASKVTDNVPASRARIPYCSRTTEVGRQLGLVANSLREICESAGAPSINTNTKIASTKMIALQPQRRMIHSIRGSMRSSPRASTRLIPPMAGQPPPFAEYPRVARLIGGVLSGGDRLILGQRNEADILDDLLTFGPVAPIDEVFHRAGGLAGCVDEQGTRDRIGAVHGCFDAGGNAGLTFLLGDLQPLHIIRLVAHSAVADGTGG